MTLLHDVLPELAVLKFQGYDTRQQEGLQITDCIDITQAVACAVKVIKPKKWDKGLGTAVLTNMLFIPHFGHSMQVNTYIK